MVLRWTMPTPNFLDPHARARAFGEHSARRRRAAAVMPAERFDFAAQLVGRTSDGNATLYVDPSLGKPGSDLAREILATLDTTCANSQAYFGIPIHPVNVIIAAAEGLTDAGRYLDDG
jgi:hypothetical protein